MSEAEPARPAPRWPDRLPPLRYAVLGLLLLAMAIAGAAAFVSPWFAFQAMRSAAAAGDLQGLDEVVDLRAVRSSLTPQVDAYLPADPPPDEAPAEAAAPRPRWLPDFVPWPLTPETGPEPLRRLTRPVTRPLRLRREVERLMTPESLARLSAGRAHVRDWGWRRFRVSTVAGGQETVWTFRRRGNFDHELVHLRLPQVSPAAAAEPSSGTPGPTPRR